MLKHTKLFFALLGMIVFLTACQNDEIALNDLDKFAAEQNEQFGEDLPRSCGTTKMMEELLSDPVYNKLHQDKLSKVAQDLKNQPTNRSNGCTDIKVIPVAVHFQNASSTASLACLRNLAQAQIDILNEDFGGTNSDISNWNNNAASSFPGVSNGEACFRFCIADKNHPNGYGLSDGQPAVTRNTTNGDTDSNWSGYLNIFVQPNTGLLGYSPLGGNGNGDGVVIDAAAFGAGSGCGNVSPDAPYNLGRTLTHELGHYLLLDHIWGNGCGVDDDVADTPSQASDHSGCPSLSTSSCGSLDMHMNYMDYTNDACMYMFSAGQISRSQSYINTSLTNLTNNASNKCSDVTGGGTTGGGTTGGGTTGGGTTGGGTTGGACAKPVPTGVVKINPNKVRVNWAAVPNATTYRIQYRKVGVTTWTLKGSVNPLRVLSNLTANTPYQYRLRAKCPSGWSGWSKLYGFKTEPSTTTPTPGNDCSTITVSVNLDDYGSETSWELVNATTGAAVATGGPYADNQAGSIKVKNVCVPDGCYTLYLDDEYGDGICCNYGNGWLEVTEGNTLITSSDGNFGYYDEMEFCVGVSGKQAGEQRKDTKDTSRPLKTEIVSQR